jgi:alpha-ketoglutarate-dependent taurine dioxygenase
VTYQTIEVRKVTPVIGAEIHGIDLAQPLGNQQFEEIHDALMDNLIVFFRDQKIGEPTRSLCGITAARNTGRSSTIILIAATAIA